MNRRAFSIYAIAAALTRVGCLSADAQGPYIDPSKYWTIACVGWPNTCHFTVPGVTNSHTGASSSHQHSGYAWGLAGGSVASTFASASAGALGASAEILPGGVYNGFTPGIQGASVYGASGYDYAEPHVVSTPEPTTAVFVATGLLGLAGIARQRRSSGAARFTDS